MRLINTELLFNPLTWVVLLLMIIIWGFIADLVLHATVGSSFNPTNI